ncbi:phosphoglycolate phosphatase [Catenovulum sediminis]|uniref:Phosphoglycolate phosphatase n=1 Tax=Catenovulum sediminis TaxID=1740262 RepID=A0ABV1RF17_9ALTE|nr:phosphoglycolate phosphatase [Catenovulum sediminis]
MSSPSQKTDILLFDLDGTLVDSAPDLALAVNDTLQQLGRNTFSQEVIRGWVGNGAKTLIERALSGDIEISPDLDPELSAKALAIFLHSYQQNVCVHSKLYDGVLNSLQTLKELGYKLAVVTNKPERFIQPILDGLGLTDVFDTLVGGDTLTQKKPAPEPLLHACQLMGASIERCLMIGDSRNDILAAKAAGTASVGLTYGYNYGEDIAQYQPEWVLDNFTDLLKILKD